MAKIRADGAPTAREDLEELRELIREAHGATRDLAQLLRQYRRAVADGAELAQKTAHDVVQHELKRFGNHMQNQMNKAAADLNAGIQRAQHHVISCLTMAELELDHETDRLKVIFRGAPFDATVPAPYPDAESNDGLL